LGVRGGGRETKIEKQHAYIECFLLKLKRKNVLMLVGRAVLSVIYKFFLWWLAGGEIKKL